jgi:hypothetical protein
MANTNSTLPSSSTPLLSPLGIPPFPQGTFATNKGQQARFLLVGNGGGRYDVVVATTIVLKYSPPNVMKRKRK